MIIKNNFLVLLLITFIVYFISDFFFADAMIYVLGALIWGAFSVLFKKELGTFTGALLDIILLVLFIRLFYWFKRKPLKYFTILVITILLYIVDLVLISYISYDPTIKDRIILNSVLKVNTFLFVRVLLKSLLLSLIIYFDNRDIVTKRVTPN